MEDELSSKVGYLQVLRDVEEDTEHFEQLTSLLREELLELDVDSVELLTEDGAPENSKGVMATVGGWLAVHFGPAGLKSVVKALAAWAGRTGKTVELTIGGNTLKLTGASAEVQARAVDEFFARQPHAG